MNLNFRIKLLIVLFVIFWTLLLSRIYFISIKSNKYYEKLADQNTINIEYLEPLRGEIFDRNNKLIATNLLGFSVSLKPHLNNKKHKLRLIEDISYICSKLTDLNETKLLQVYKKMDSIYNHKPVQVVRFIPYDKIIVEYVKLIQNENISISPKSKRLYPFSEVASHILGYVSRANKQDIQNSDVAKHLGVIGKDGIEKYYDPILSGTMGKKVIKVTAKNREIQTLSYKKPKSSSISLTIDMRLQSYIKELFKGINGAIIVIDINDGSILAAGSYPEYDINKFTQGISKTQWKDMIEDLNHPFTNKFVHGLYPPGSSTKPAVALSFLNSKLVDENIHKTCTGEISLGKRKFRCWASWGHGEVNLKRSISESCDVYFYRGGLEVGINAISTDLTRYGFGQKTGVDLPNEFIGVVPSRNWKINKFGESWYKGDTLNTVIGQGDFLTTPMQVAQFTALIAKGKQIVPHFLKSADEQNTTFGSFDLLNDLEKSKLKVIKEGMYDVCNHKRGTAYKYNFSKITMAGKTGTSQVIGIPQQEKQRMSEDDLKYFQKSHAWFTTFAPYQKPRYVVTTIIEHGGHGGEAAGEIVSKVYNKLLDLDYIDKKYIRSEYRDITIPNQTTP